ncbi:MAG: hypothetical protein WC876_05420 [Candidatus Thermoplasmatota archaeon]|jgi:hypothetical protein
MWAGVHWRLIAGLASFGTAALLLLVAGVRATRFDLLAIAATCLVLGSLAWVSRHNMKRSVP